MNKRCLVDANVWLALLLPRHTSHAAASAWFEPLHSDQAGMCRMVQLALIRLLGNPAIMGTTAMAAKEAWAVLQDLQQDVRVIFLPEPPELERAFGNLLRYPFPTGKLVNDAYLAAFAVAASLELVTRDRGFRQFHGLEANLLS